MKKIIKGDQVIVLAGKDKGKIGKVASIVEGKVIVDGINLVKRHQKPNHIKGVNGGVVLKNMPLDMSNVAILNPETKKADRVAIKVVKTEKGIVRFRVFKSTGAEIS